MKIDKETQDNLQELQISEQTLQSLLMQKQAFQIELNETKSATEEVEKSKDELYKITGQIMIKSKKEEILQDLKEKKDILELRIKAIENQEWVINEKSQKLKKKVEEKFNSKNKIA